MAFSVKVHSYEFRVRKADHMVESRCEARGMDWAVRNPAELNMSDDHISVILNTILTLVGCFPAEEQQLPIGADITEHTRHKEPVSGTL